MKHGKMLGLVATVALLMGLAVIPVMAQSNPQLSEPSVSPSTGTSLTDFYYYVSYYDADGDSPVVKQVYIDGVAHSMSFYSGSETNGVYRYGPANPGIGSTHEYYFYFYDGKDDEARLPMTGSYFGPLVTPSFAEDNPDAAEGLESILDKLVTAYGYKTGEGIGGWTVYNPEWAVTHPDWNTLTTLYVRRGYWINLSENYTLEYGAQTYELDAGWNLIGWVGW